MSCHHMWEQLSTEEFTENGVAMKRYKHKCFHCPKVKVTVRLVRGLPPTAKWKRELEKLMEKAAQVGLNYQYDGQPMTIEKVAVLENK